MCVFRNSIYRIPWDPGDRFLFGGLPIEITVDWFDKANGPTQSVHNVADLSTLKQSEYGPFLEN